MRKALNTLIASRSKQDLTELDAVLSKIPGLSLSKRHISNGHSDPLHGTPELPDVLVLGVGELWEEELKALAARPATQRPPSIVVGPGGDMQVIRKAMQAGACDFLARPVEAGELADIIRKLHRDNQETGRGSVSKLTTVINAKGGSGASTIACNIAHLMAARQQRRVALLDLDLQFGALPLYLDLRPQYTLTDALDIGVNLDKAALEGCMAKHQSGLHVLAPQPQQLMLPGEIAPEQLERIIEVASTNYEHVVADLPRQIDPLTSLMLDNSNRILVVVQQTLSHLRDAVRLLGILTEGLSIQRESITVVVNRYDSSHSIPLKQVTETLHHAAIVTVPNDFKRVAESINLGIPLGDSHPRARPTQAISGLAEQLSGQTPQKRGLLSRALPFLDA